MADSIYLLQDNGELIEMNEQDYDSEDLLQGLVAKYPNLLAGDQINKESPRKWLLITREVAIASEEEGAGRWSVDHVFVDQEGIPTIVEVKRSSDTRIRREVIGQIIEYAANATLYLSADRIREQFELRCQEEDLDAEQEIELHTEGVAPDSFWQKVESNLKTGKIRMIILADEIPAELKRIVEFLNEQMNPAEFLAVEVKQFVGNELKTLVPRLVGQTSEAQVKKNASSKQWDFDSFMAELENNTSKDEVEVAKRIYDWAKPKMTRIWWGTGKTEGSFVPILNYNNTDYQLFSVRSKGYLELYFYWYQKREPFREEGKRKELLSKINAVLENQISEEAINKLPKVSLSELKDGSKIDEILTVYDWFLNEVKTQ